MKRKLSSLVVLFIMLFLSLLLNPTKAFACSCLPPQSPTVERDRSDAVFLGTVVEVEFENNQQITTLEIEKGWKGITSETAVVYSSDNTAACGFPFEKGRKYIVYANRENASQLSTNLCSRTKELALAKEDIEALGTSQIIQPSITLSPTIIPTTASPAILHMMVPLLVIIIAAGGIYIFINKRSN